MITVLVNRGKLPAKLSEREWQVIDMRVRGLRAKAVATHLQLSPKTIDTYQTSALRKLGVGNIAEAIHLCYRLGAIIP